MVSTELPLIYTGASKPSIIPLKYHILQLFIQRKKNKHWWRLELHTHTVRDAWVLIEFIIWAVRADKVSTVTLDIANKECSRQTKKHWGEATLQRSHSRSVTMMWRAARFPVTKFSVWAYAVFLQKHTQSIKRIKTIKQMPCVRLLHCWDKHL